MHVQGPPPADLAPGYAERADHGPAGQPRASLVPAGGGSSRPSTSTPHDRHRRARPRHRVRQGPRMPGDQPDHAGSPRLGPVRGGDPAARGMPGAVVVQAAGELPPAGRLLTCRKRCRAGVLLAARTVIESVRVLPVEQPGDIPSDLGRWHSLVLIVDVCCAALSGQNPASRPPGRRLNEP